MSLPFDDTGMIQFSDNEESNAEESEYEDDDDDEEEDSEDGVTEQDLSALPDEDDSAEVEIEGDFDRLVKNIRQPSTTTPDFLTREWDITISEREAEFKDDLRAASGIGKPKGTRGGRKKGSRPTGPPLSPQVKSLLGEGNQAYVDSNFQEAIRVMQEVIRIEPRAVQAWSVLARCYHDMGDEAKALRTRIMGAHLRHDAEEWERLAIESKEMGYKQQAMYCYRKLYSLDPDNIDAIWDRAALAKDVGDLKTARNSLLSILKRFPHDLTVLDELRPILIELSQLSLCATLFRDAFQHYSTLFPNPSIHPSNLNIDPNLLQEQPIASSSTSTAQHQRQHIQAPFTALHVLVLADLYNTLGSYDEAIHAIRRGTRWLQGRKAQIFWDACDDDREYDICNPDGTSVYQREDSTQDLTPASGGDPLDVNARHRLAVARIKMGDIGEGNMHAQIILANDVLDYAPLFIELADAYYDREMWGEAKVIYEALGGDAATSSVYVLLQTAACLRMMDDLKEAAEVYLHVVQADPTHNDAKMKLAEIYEIMNEPRKALELVYEVIASRKKTPKEANTTSATNTSLEAPTSSLSLFEEQPTTGKKKSKPSTTTAQINAKLQQEQLRKIEEEREREVLRRWGRVRGLWRDVFGVGYPGSVGEGEEGGEEDVGMDVDVDGDKPSEKESEWLVEAEKLVETFRETRALFTTAKGAFKGVFPLNRSSKKKAASSIDEGQEERMISRLHLDMDMETSNRKSRAEGRFVDFFRGVSFAEWLRLFLQYSFLLTRRGQYEVADEVLRHLLHSNAYSSREMQTTLRLALITISIHARQYLTIVEHSRKIILSHQFNNEPHRILLASLASGLHPTEAFISSALQKYLSREVRIADGVVKNPGGMRWNRGARRWAPTVPSGSGNIVGRGKGKGKEKEKEELRGDEEDEDDGDGGGDGDGDAGVDDAVVDGSGVMQPPALPKKANPILTTVYGQMCIAAKSYQSALFYLLYSYENCPEDPIICLSLAIASLGRAMQRQADNRHHLITQAIGFLSQYRKIRKETADEYEEVEFNFGRAFHQLGLYSLAVKHYETVLELAEKNPDNTNSVAKEAAYNLAMIFVFTGARHLADDLYRRWLSL